jgi:2-dehydro-3-deoxyphosphogluconate aldolase/(4S)-4-hydroxy-2-oxoglutarate aldolase
MVIVTAAEEHVRAGKLLAIIRVPELTQAAAVAMTEVLVAAGVRAPEFTLTSRGALDAIGVAAAVAGDRAAVGGGTVLYADQVRAVEESGGQFVVSPHVSPEVIAQAHELGLLCLPGAFTATEAQLAVDNGARMVKLFPAQPAGPAYLRALRGPLNEIAFVPTGGVGIDGIGAFLAAGAVAVALGSSLVRSTEDLEGLRTRAQAAVAAIHNTDGTQ